MKNISIRLDEISLARLERLTEMDHHDYQFFLDEIKDVTDVRQSGYSLTRAERSKSDVIRLALALLTVSIKR